MEQEDRQLFSDLEAAVAVAGEFVKGAAGRARVVEGTAIDAVNPTADIDRETDALLCDALMAAYQGRTRPAYMTEERVDDLARLGAREVLIVDPIDGTRNLLRGHPEASVSVALWREGALVWGCVVNPFRGECFTAIKGEGTRLNGLPVRVSPCKDPANALLLVSRSEHASGRLEPVCGHIRCEPIGSVAYKMARVAAGLAEATFTVNQRSQWDLAAGDLLVREAGGRVTDAAGNDLVFNQPNVQFRGLLASNNLLHDWLKEVTTRVSRW
jgi:myo-inositol-1(or 4)-monophosphatase